MLRLVRESTSTRIGSLVIALSLEGAGCSNVAAPPSRADTPPANPTHHAVVTGRVVVVDDAPGPFAGGTVGVGVRYATSAAADRRVSVTGGAEADASGQYRVIVNAQNPPRADAVAEVLLMFVRVGPAGVPRREVDSLRVSVQFGPVAMPPTTTTVPERRIP